MFILLQQLILTDVASYTVDMRFFLHHSLAFSLPLSFPHFLLNEYLGGLHIMSLDRRSGSSGLTHCLDLPYD